MVNIVCWILLSPKEMLYFFNLTKVFWSTFQCFSFLHTHTQLSNLHFYKMPFYILTHTLISISRAVRSSVYCPKSHSHADAWGSNLTYFDWQTSFLPLDWSSPPKSSAPFHQTPSSKTKKSQNIHLSLPVQVNYQKNKWTNCKTKHAQLWSDHMVLFLPPLKNGLSRLHSI